MTEQRCWQQAQQMNLWYTQAHTPMRASQVGGSLHGRSGARPGFKMHKGACVHTGGRLTLRATFKNSMRCLQLIHARRMECKAILEEMVCIAACGHVRRHVCKAVC